MSASFLSAMNTRAEDAVEKTSATENECPVCYDPCAKLSVTCCNGHTICEKHYLQRYKAIYEDGRLAFGDDGVHSVVSCVGVTLKTAFLARPILMCCQLCKYKAC
jgi:hypothetical protein